MAIIFVHGVNTRQGPGYDAAVLATEKFLRRHLTGITVGGKTLPDGFHINFPYWGDLATTFAWDGAALPHGDMVTLGGSADEDLQPLVAHLRDALGPEVGPEPLTALAKKDFTQAVDILSEIALQNAERGEESATADFVVRASAYAAANPAPPWLAGVMSDSELISRLDSVVAGPSGLRALDGGLGGTFDAISEGCHRLKEAVLDTIGSAIDRSGDLASTKLLAWTREPLNAVLGRFFGDIFIYLDTRKDRAQPGKIPMRILDAFESVLQGSRPEEPLIVVGHSLGGVIVFDLLSYFKPEIEADLFVSVGSQVAHFEEIKLYRASDVKVRAPSKAKMPGNIKHWINIYDEVDIFAYAANGVFERVVDYRYDTRTYTVKAHSAYLQQDRFYARLRARIDELPPHPKVQ